MTEEEVRALPNDLIEARQSGEKLFGMALDVFRWCQDQSLNPEIDYWSDEVASLGRHYIRVHW